jgi:hypothetical protein
LASRAADFEDNYLLLEEALHSMSLRVEEKIRGIPSTDVEKPSVQATFSLPENVAGLKKKERRNNGSKQKKTWIEKLKKKKRNSAKKNNTEKKKTSKLVQHEESGSVAPDSQAYERSIQSALEGYQVYESLSSFNQLLMVCCHFSSYLCFNQVYKKDSKI